MFEKAQCYVWGWSNVLIIWRINICWLYPCCLSYIKETLWDI